MKKQYGCETDIRPYDFFGETLTRCPLRMVLDDPDTLAEAAEHFEWFERGFLPAPGTWYDQTEPWIAYMNAIKSAHLEADKHDADKRSRGGDGDNGGSPRGRPR
jgi:hypothetical protein